MATLESVFSDRERLVQLVQDTYELLARITRRHPRWIPRDLRSDFSVTIAGLAAPVEATIRELSADPTSSAAAELTQRLAVAGLSGAQLDLETKIADSSRREFENVTVTLGSREFAPKTYAKSALQGADVPLDTLAKVIPFAQPIVEAKHGLEWVLDNSGVLRKIMSAPIKVVKRFPRLAIKKKESRAIA